MKRLIFIATMLFTPFIWAQDSTNIKVEAPRIMTKLSYGEMLNYDDVKIKFVEVLQDSRCPKNVDCVWAGEVVILVDIFVKGKKNEQMKLTLSPTNQVQNQIGNLYSSEKLKISVFNVLPYPVFGLKTKAEDYFIHLEVRDN